MTGQSVGFVGVGKMGGRMARRLLQAGIALTVYDTSDAAVKELQVLGATVADSPQAVGSACEIVLLCLPTPPIVHTVALGPNGVSDGNRVRIVVDMSTTGAAYARRIAEGLAAKGMIGVDAPVSGGLAGAANGTLAVMLSCAADLAPRLTPILQNLGTVFHVGVKPGMGQTMKLLNNLLSATAMAISSEAVVMGVKAGLDAKQIIDVLNAGTGRNSATEFKFPKFVLTRTFDLGFPLSLLNKDVRLALEEADALGIPMMVGTAVRQLIAVAEASEGPDADMSELVKPIERWAGVTVK
ncbi:MAG TPA: NAD(P)-dependent oxidoreductase [Terriglobia bacterium]|nr:NAD(P)-dependent oxidoreductase [Terriglobia bacterium]